MASSAYNALLKISSSLPFRGIRDYGQCIIIYYVESFALWQGNPLLLQDAELQEEVKSVEALAELLVLKVVAIVVAVAAHACLGGQERQ